jgi:N-acetylglucosamine malate deacetylase 2
MSAVLGIFAHPDDEAFGPGGTLATLAKEHDVYLICVTNGDAGINSSKKTKELGEIRREELLASSKIVGVKKVFFLNYKDGSLSHNIYHEIAEKVKDIISDLKPETLLTFEPRGVSGHLDHIAVSMIASYVFEEVDFVKELWYYCITEKARSLHEKYFIYFPPGYKASDISKTVDISAVWDKKVEAINEHESQKHDVDKILAIYNSQEKKAS